MGTSAAALLCAVVLLCCATEPLQAAEDGYLLGVGAEAPPGDVEGFSRTQRSWAAHMAVHRL